MAETGFNFADTVGLGVINTGLSFLSSLAQKKMNEDTAIKMNERYYTPRAQAANLTAAGINPAVAFGNNAPVFHSGSSLGSVSAPSVGIGTTSLSDLATYIKSVADAKKAGVDTKLSEQEIKNKEVERQAKEFELELRKYFGGSDFASKIALAWSDVALKQDEHSINEWKKVSAEAVAKADEHQRDILKKVLDNKDTELELSNELLRQKSATEKSSQAANYASAAASSASAEQTEIFNKIYSDQRYKHSLITQAVESGRKAVEERKLTKSQADHMNYMVQQAAYATDMQEFTYWSNQIQSFVHSIGEAASSFYGAGSLRELIKLRQAQQIAPARVSGFTP